MLSGTNKRKSVTNKMKTIFVLTPLGPTHGRDSWPSTLTLWRRLGGRRARRQPSAADRCAHPTRLPAHPRDPPRTRGARRRLGRAAPRLLTDRPLGTPCVPLTASFCPPSACVQAAPTQRPASILATSNTNMVRPPASAARKASTLAPSPPLVCSHLWVALHGALPCSPRLTLIAACARPAVHRLAGQAHGAAARAHGPRRRPPWQGAAMPRCGRVHVVCMCPAVRHATRLGSRPRAGPRARHLGRRRRRHAARRLRASPGPLGAR